jgi:dehydrogenase/reductase SDR family member 4
MSMFDLSGKVALITGSTKGIGKAIATRMCEAGARVVVSSRKADMCDQVAGEINQRHGKNGAGAIAVPCNISDKAQLQALVDKTMATWGKIDILVPNAGVNPFAGPAAKIPDSAWDKIMETNVRSTFWLCMMVLPQMVERKQGGSVTIIASVSGLKANTVIGAYAISKVAEHQLARNLAAEYGPHGIRVNAIAPGLIKTDFARYLWEDPVRAEKVNQSLPLRRFGEPDDIAGAALFLASQAGAYVTGHVLNVDGGSAII